MAMRTAAGVAGLNPMTKTPCHVLHVVYRFAAGGLENVIVQLINELPEGGFRHTVLALTTIDEAFATRIKRQDVQLISLNKGPGQPFKLYPRVYRILRQLKPDVFHTCNLAALEFAPVAFAAGVPLRVHAEHGWDISDPDGSNRSYKILRRLYQPFVHRFVVVSNQLRDYLLQQVRVPASKVSLIPNGVDLRTFRPIAHVDEASVPDGWPFDRAQHWVVGTVGRQEPIKNQMLLARAVVRLLQERPGAFPRLRVVMVGAGPLHADIQRVFDDAGESGRLWMPGVRSDIASILRHLDCFVLPSLAEGTSCTLQEAMATALPIIATRVGGNSSLLQDGRLGTLVPADDVSAMAEAIGEKYGVSMPNTAANEFVRQTYDLQNVLNRYCLLFTKG